MDLNDLVDLVMTVEAAFGVEIEDSDAAAMRTVEDLSRAVTKCLKGSASPTPAEIWDGIVSILEVNGIAPERIKRETRLADLFEG